MGAIAMKGTRIRRWHVVALVAVAATAAWSWASLREERAAQVKAHTVLAFTDQFGRPAAGYRVRLCTMRVGWWSWLLPWHPYGYEQRDLTADERGEVHVTGRHRYLWLRELDRAQYVSPVNWSTTTPVGERINWGELHRPFDGRLVYGVLRRQEGAAPVSEWMGPDRFEVKVRGCGSERGTAGFVPLAVDGSGPEDGRLRVEAEAVSAVGRTPGPRAYHGWRVRVVGERAEVLRDQSGELVTFAPETGYADRFEIDGATLGHAHAFVRTKHYWWHAEIDVFYQPKNCAITVQPMRLRTNRNGSNDLFDRVWESNFSPHRCVGE